MDQQQKIEKNFSDKQQEVLQSIRIRRIILPVLLGIGVVGYLLWKQFDPQEFARISWTGRMWGWLLVAVGLLGVRHLAYSLRLRILSIKDFSWRKCIELIFIWEFSSAVSPTAVGGSAVAFFVLAQEKLSTARTATIVLYTVVLDTIFFIGTLPVLYLFFGSGMIRPDLEGFTNLDGWGITFLVAYAVMATYGAVFYYGLFVSPRQIKRILVGFTRIAFLKRYRRDAVKLGNDMMVASSLLKQQNWRFHIGAFLSTAVAWSCRFLVLNCVIIAFLESMPTDFWTQFGLYARLETMFVIIAFSPTPGGAGFVEILFNGFLTDYVQQETQSLLIASVWRMISYYFYLLAGAIVIPNWIRKILAHRMAQKRKAMKEQADQAPDIKDD